MITLIDYYQNNDILYLHILPYRSSRLQEVNEDFFVCYDWDNPQQVVIFEIYYFSLLASELDDPLLEPYLEMRFDVVDSDLRQASLRQILTWARQRFQGQPFPLYELDKAGLWIYNTVISRMREETQNECANC